MKQYSMYSVKIKHYNQVFHDTAVIYRNAVDFFIHVIHKEWERLSLITVSQIQVTAVEVLTVCTKTHPDPRYNFGAQFYKFPCYLRRAAIMEALGKVSSYRSNLANWEQEEPSKRGKRPGLPKAGIVYPAMYRDNMYVRVDDYTARIKVFIRNTWDWLTVHLNKGDADYILHHCSGRKACVPTLQKRGKEWFLDFVFEETCTLTDTPVSDQIIVACDLGINNACTCAVMRSDGTILGRHFLKLSRELDCLSHAIGRIKKAQRHGAARMPRLWNRAKGINDDIAVKTANFIIDTAVLYSADTIVFEHLDVRGKKRGFKKQRLHHWRAQYVQNMVTDKAHCLSMRISRICAWGTSRLAFNGSGRVSRGIYTVNGEERYNYSICTFQDGKVYHADLNAAYNIGSRYFVKELTKSLSARMRQELEAKDPSALKRSTCTLSTLINLNAVLSA